jgi:hypothetical protein
MFRSFRKQCFNNCQYLNDSIIPLSPKNDVKPLFCPVIYKVFHRKNNGDSYYWYKSLEKKNYVICANVDVYSKANTNLEIISSKTATRKLIEESVATSNDYKNTPKQYLGYCIYDTK